MPSQIGNPGNVVNVTANYLVAHPSTKFSTRELAFVVIDMDNSTYFNDGYVSNSHFSQVVRAVQVVAEIQAVGTPYNGVVTVVVVKDTTSDGDNTSISGLENAFAKTIYQQLQNSGINVDSVSIRSLRGGDLSGSEDLMTYSAG